jgi:hypothetical protein
MSLMRETRSLFLGCRLKCPPLTVKSKLPKLVGINTGSLIQALAGKAIQAAVGKGQLHGRKKDE